jgi:hypothetical protein
MGAADSLDIAAQASVGETIVNTTCKEKQMKLHKTVPVIVAGAIALIAGNAQANTISLLDETGNAFLNGNNPGVQYEASCDPASAICMQGFLEQDTTLGNINPALDPNMSTSNVDGEATAYDIGKASEDQEVEFLNKLLTAIGAATVNTAVGCTGTQVCKSDTEQDSFTTNREYFSIKQEQLTAFFKNTSGGAVTVNFDPTNWSHFTEYGAVVPIPAAAWLFGSALVGLAAIGRRRRANALAA